MTRMGHTFPVSLSELKLVKSIETTPCLGVELTGVPLAESVEFATFADTARPYFFLAQLG